MVSLVHSRDTLKSQCFQSVAGISIVHSEATLWVPNPGLFSKSEEFKKT